VKQRQDWFDGQLDLDPARLVFIDETWASTNMARLKGRAPKGERLRAAVPQLTEMGFALAAKEKPAATSKPTARATFVGVLTVTT
jgi:hypothetical protein